MTQKKIQIYFYLVLFAGILILAYYIFKPYFSMLIMAATFAVVFAPVNYRIRNFLSKYIRWKKGDIARVLAALSTLIIFLLILVVPLSFLGFQLLNESRQLYSIITSEHGLQTINSVVMMIEESTQKYMPNFSLDLTNYLQHGVNLLATNISAVFQSIGSLLLGVFIVLLGMYYLLKDGDKLKDFFIKVSPLPDNDEKKIFNKIKEIINVIIRGSLIVALTQGLSTGIGFAIFGIPSPTIWGSLAAVAAIIPTVGTALILVPGIIYLILTGHLLYALGLLIWGIMAVGLIDDLLRPYLINRSVPIHPFLILLSILGGLTFFGPLGFLVGPLVLSLVFAFVEIYPDIIKPKSAK